MAIKPLQQITKRTRLTYNCAHLRSTKESLTFEYDIWWYWDSIGRYGLIVLGQYGAELVDTLWVSTGRYWLVLGGTGSVWGGTGCYLVVLCQYNFVLLGIKWYCVSIGILCLYILKQKSGDLVGCYNKSNKKNSVQFVSRHFANKFKKS